MIKTKKSNEKWQTLSPPEEDVEPSSGPCGAAAASLRPRARLLGPGLLRVEEVPPDLVDLVPLHAVLWEDLQYQPMKCRSVCEASHVARFRQVLRSVGEIISLPCASSCWPRGGLNDTGVGSYSYTYVEQQIMWGKRVK